MLRKIYEFIDDYIRDNDIPQVICFIVGWILGFCLLFFQVFDSTPATRADYEPLITQNNVVQEDFNKVYTYDNYEIVPSEKNVKVTFSNDQCKLKCTYDKNLKFINYEEIDLAKSKLSSILVSLFIAFVLFATGFVWVFAIFLPFILSYLLKFLEWICLLLVGRR